jgi:hypothetical protein
MPIILIVLAEMAQQTVDSMNQKSDYMHAQKGKEFDRTPPNTNITRLNRRMLR